MRGRATVRLRRCRGRRTETSASPWSGPPNVRRLPPRPPGTRTRTTTADVAEALSHARVRLFPLVRAVRSRGADRAGADGRAGRFPVAVDLRPLPSVERRAGPEPLRLVGDRRAVRGRVP